MKRVLNKDRVFYTAMISLITIVVILIAIGLYNSFLKKDKEEEVVVKNKLDSLELYGYTLDDMDTELYKTYFGELKSILNEKEKNYEDYAKAIVKLFVADFYNLDSKISSSDFGGLEFIHPDILSNFKINAGDTMYNHIKTNLDGDRNQKLPIVNNVEITNLENTTYVYNEKTYDAYKITAKWEYKEDLGYESEGIFFVIKDGNKLHIVEKSGD